MSIHHPALTAFIAATFSLFTCTVADAAAEPTTLSFADPISLGNPDGNAADQFLISTADGQVLMSWTEAGRKPRSRDAFLAVINGPDGAMGAPQRINDEAGRVHFYGGDNRTKLTVAPDGSVTAIWAATLAEFRTGELRTAHAAPDGEFLASARLNDDELPVNHAFATLATSPNGKVYAVWIDGRNREFLRMGKPTSPAEMRKDIKMRDMTIPDAILRMPPRPRKIYQHEHAQLFMAVSEDGGKSFGANYPISSLQVCPCCVPNIAFLDGGETLVVSYRFVTDSYLRDQVVIRSTDAGKTFGEPIYISDDGWVANFCPHAGTSLIADAEGTVHSLWFTVGRSPEDAGIYYTSSTDDGASFAPRQLIVATPAHTVFHTQIIVDEDNRLWATWENITEDNPQIYLAYREPGASQWSEVVQVSDGSQLAMLPTLAVSSGKVYVAWQEMQGESSAIKLRTAALDK
jgi:hypothetical protein